MALVVTVADIIIAKICIHKPLAGPSYSAYASQLSSADRNMPLSIENKP